MLYACGKKPAPRAFKGGMPAVRSAVALVAILRRKRGGLDQRLQRALFRCKALAGPVYQVR
jgi:hypothetical protein